jgi:invasion protein IalB
LSARTVGPFSTTGQDFMRDPYPFLAAALIIGMAGAVAAQEHTTATYEAWVLECDVQAGPPVQKTCAIGQTQVAQVQGRNNPISHVAIRRPAKGQPVRLEVQVPVNVSLNANLRVQTSDNDPGVAAPFARCLPAGCFADLDLKDDVIKKFRAATDNGKMTFKSANGQEVAIPVLFKGFGAAFDALGKD